MKTANLRVGVKGAPAVTVPVNTAENLDDVQTLSKGSLDVLIRCFNRGFRIESQERSGARDYIRDHPYDEKDEKAKSAASGEVAKIVAAYDPTIVHPRTVGPRKPVEIKLAKGKKAYTPDELAALLAAHGVKATLVTPE